MGPPSLGDAREDPGRGNNANVGEGLLRVLVEGDSLLVLIERGMVRMPAGGIMWMPAEGGVLRVTVEGGIL